MKISIKTNNERQTSDILDGTETYMELPIHRTYAVGSDGKLISGTATLESNVENITFTYKM